MRLLVLVLVLVLVNGAVYVSSTRPTSDELERLGLRQRELDGALAVEEKIAGEWSHFTELVEAAQSVVEPLSSADGSAQSGLRRAFLEAEKGLGLRRDALEFRPERTQLPNGFDGVRIRVIEAGRFTDLVTYLHRISHLKVPMVPAEMSLVKATTGAEPLVLSATFSASWPEEAGTGDEGQTAVEGDRDELGIPERLHEEALPRLMQWLQADESSARPLPSRDIFRRGAPVAVAPTTTAPATPVTSEREPFASEQPRLTGFVFGGGRIDEPVAAIRFDGRMWLVGVGEQVGPFRVEDMVVGEEATLVHQDSGESLRLTIQ
jgi:hypothetical protein